MITGESHEYFGGLDLGQKRDYSALAVLDKSTLYTDERDPVTYAFRTEVRYALRHLERIPLGTDYVDVVQRVCRVAARREIRPFRLAVDATGVGAAVVDLLRRGGGASSGAGSGAGPGAASPFGGDATAMVSLRSLAPVVITGGVGGRMRYQKGSYYVPRKDLLDLPVVMLERGELLFASNLRQRHILEAELLAIGTRPTASGNPAEHDDLVFALALATWRAVAAARI
jgi:hypothetical protein